MTFGTFHLMESRLMAYTINKYKYQYVINENPGLESI